MTTTAVEKLAALAAWDQGEKPQDIAARLNVAPATLYFWRKKHLDGESLEPRVETMAKKKAARDVEKTASDGRLYRPDTLKREIVDAYFAAPSTERKAAVLEKHGVARDSIYKWRDRLASKRGAARSQATPPVDVARDASREAPPPADASNEVYVLRIENARLKRLLKALLADDLA